MFVSRRKFVITISKIRNYELTWWCSFNCSVADPDPDPPDPRVLGLLDPDPDPLVRGMDPDPDPDLDPFNIKQK
jgi:hypothetical protein